MNPGAKSLNPVIIHSMAHTYIEAYLFSMIIFAYLCIKTVYFNLYWNRLCVTGFVMLFSSLLQTEDNGLSLWSQNMV